MRAGVRARPVRGGFVIEYGGVYVFDEDLAQAREWGAELAALAAPSRTRAGDAERMAGAPVRRPARSVPDFAAPR